MSETSESQTAAPPSLDFFILDDCMYHVSQIIYLRLDGGANGCGCWGEIELRGEPRCTIGDGNYANDGKHIQHRVAGEFGFIRLREIMRKYGSANQ